MEFLEDFDGLFDLLDYEKNGFLTVEQIQDFHESIHYKAINSKHIKAACRHVCGKQDKVDKDHFLPILEDLARRQMVEEQARWDFLALDTNASYCIAVKDALLLFRATHGDNFSMQTWQRFLKSRENPSAEVSFDEIKMWLCDHPIGEPYTENEYLGETSRMDNYNQKEAENDFEMYQQNKKSKGHESFKYQDYRDDTKRMARYKQQRWEKEGVEALLYDDGSHLGEELPRVIRKKVRASDLFECLDIKYQMLRKLLFLQMLEGDMGEIMWSALTDSEQHQALQQLKLQVEQLIKEDMLNETTTRQLPGSQIVFDYGLGGMMGEVSSEKLFEQLNETRNMLQNEEKDKDVIEEELRGSFETAIDVPATSNALVLALEQRYKQEKEKIMASLSVEATTTDWSSNQLITGYCRLIRQLAVAKLEEDFTALATAVGIAERPQNNNSFLFLPDLMFQEKLASYRMTLREGRRLSLPQEEIDVANIKQSGKPAALLLLVEELTWKHAHEWQEFVNMLGEKGWKSVMVMAEQMTPEERKHWQSSLHQQRLAWKNSSVDYRLTQRKQHHEILLNATGVFLAGIRGELEKLRGPNGVDDGILCAVVLRDLQIQQDIEFESLLQEIVVKTEDELAKLALLARSSRREEHLDNIATLLLGSFDLSDDERPFMKALEEKYLVLQHLLLNHALKAEHGLAWERLTEEEQQRKLVRKKMEMDHLLQSDIHLKDVSSIIGAIPKEFPNLRTLIGESKGEYNHRISTFVALPEKDLKPGMDPSKIHESDEVLPESVKSINLVADIRNRFFTEQSDLLTLLRSTEFRSRSPTFHLLQLALIKFEQNRAEKEDWFDLACFSLGLLERNKAALEKRHPADNWRQSQLAELRVELYFIRVSRGQLFKKEPDEYARPATGDTVGWILSLLKEMEKKHVEEREILMSTLQDPSLEELLEPAQQMTHQERAERLSQLRTKAFNIDLEDRGQREESFSILEEAAAIKSVNEKEKLETQGLDSSQKKIIVLLLTHLQDEQDRELAKLMQKLHLMDENEMMKARKFEIKQRHQEVAEGVLKILTQYEGGATDDELLKALDEKYDALKDKLLMEALMKQIGEKGWQELSEKERQERLMRLKLQERKLRREGKLDELAALFEENQISEDLLRKMLGESKAEHERRLRERLAKRERRIAEGLDPDVDEDEAETDEKKDALMSLTDRYQQDKDALLARLRGMNTEYLSEQERQAELVRLRRERLLAEKADSLENAALLVGLAERQGMEAQERFEKDRLRQEQLAKERLEHLRQKRNQKEADNCTVIENGSTEVLMEAVVQRLDEKQEAERALLVELLDGTGGDSQLIAAAMSQLECEEKLRTLSGQFETEKNNKQLLEDAANTKTEYRRKTLSKKEGSEVSDEEVKVTVMADLQDKQDQEMARVIADMQQKDNDELVSLQKSYIQQRDSEIKDSVAAVLFASETAVSEEDQLVNALDSKYDVLRDKIIAEALMQQLGESTWLNLSEKERQRKIAQMKLEERRLRREGRDKEASDLLGDALRNQEALNKLLSDTKVDQERKLRERLARRQQAREKGLSEEEIDQLEEEEIKKEEEELQRRNVLLTLKNEYDKERDELLKSLEASKNAEDAERKRQLMISRLKREQRRMKQEERFDAAAVLMNMAKAQEERLESDKERQLQLARARLEARRARKANGQKTLETSENQAGGSDSDDVDILREALTREIEAKHQHEREYLLQVIDSDETVQFLGESSETSDDELIQQLMMLRNKRDDFRRTGELANINSTLEEGVGLKMLLMKHSAENDGNSTFPEDLAIKLLADLQEQQDQEMHRITSNIDGQEAEDLKQMKNAQALAREQGWNDNIAEVVLGSGSEKLEENEILDALDKKYDALRDKLLMEALISQMGEAEWTTISEKERQQKLMKIKLEEKKLRREGRYDEAAALLGQLVENQNEYNRKLGETRKSQAQKLEERLKRRKELMMERGAKGLSTDETLLDALLQEEEEQENVKRKNILEELQHHYDEEKEALLAAVKGQNDRKVAEQNRQAELVRLKREQQRLEKEDNFESAALLLHVAEEQQRNRQADLAKERERQRELAKERLAARRKRQQQKDKVNEEVDEGEVKEQLVTLFQQDQTADAIKQLAGVKPSEMVLYEVDKKHEDERETILNLIENGRTQLNQQDELSYQELNEKLESLETEVTKWQQQSKQEAENAEELHADDRNFDIMARRKKELLTILSSAVTTKLKMEVDVLMKNNGMQGASADEEISIQLLTALQEKQGAELKAVEAVVNEQDEDVLKRMHNTLRSYRQEGAVDNIIKVIFEPSKNEMSEALQEEDEEFLAKKEDLEEQLNEEFEQEKEDLLNKAKAGQLDAEVDLDTELKKLEEQQEARKRALDKAFDSQRQKVKARLEAKRTARDLEEYKTDVVNEMLRKSLQESTALQDVEKQEKGRQNELMKQRLAARREARKKAMEDEMYSTSSSASSTPIPPGSALRRRKSSLGDALSEGKGQEIFSQLVREQTDLRKKVIGDQQRQQEMVEQRLLERKNRRKGEINALFSMGERQKSILEKSQKEEKDRQITAMKERVARVRYERTMTTKDTNTKLNPCKFDDLISDAEASGLSDNEKMELAAKRMQEQLQSHSGNVDDADTITSNQLPKNVGQGKTLENEKMQERKDKKKKLRQKLKKANEA